MSQDARLTSLLARHQALLASPDSCRRLVQQLKSTTRQPQGGPGSRLRRLLGFAWRLLLVYTFCTVSLNCIENSYPNTAHLWRSGRALSYLNLVYLKSYRWLTVQLGFYRSEFLHSRDRESCLVPNPFYRPPVMCCGCQQLARIPRVRLNTPAGRDIFRGVLDRHLTPFLVEDSGHRPVTYAELRRSVQDTWDDVNSGSNRISVQQPAKGVQPVASLSELLQDSERPPAARLTSWTYGHMSAIRAIRRLVARPPFLRPDVDHSFARAFYLLAGPPEEDSPLGDLSEFQGVAVLLGLHGRLRVSVSAKPECCPSNGGVGAHRNASVVLAPGQALVLPCQCYLVHLARLMGEGEGKGEGEGYAMAHLFSLFSSTGIKQAAPITGRKPETDEVADEY